MSQAEELLNNLSNDEINAATINPETEEHIVVGPDRVIKVPESLKRIAVQHDHNMETVTFDCPRYWDGIDMSAMKVLINYVRADGKLGSYKAENVTVDESDNTIMHFTWTITRNVSDEDGSIAFLVCTRKTDSEGNEENHWSTELNKDLYVSPGLDCHESIAEMYPDVITYILERLGSGTGGTGEAGVGIKSIKQTKTSTESGGENIVTFTLTDNTTYTASIRNGAKGKSAYEYAKEGGYTGTEDEFKTKLSAEWATKGEVNQISEQIANIGGLCEPMEDDLPKVFIDGVIPTTKDDVLAEMTYISKTDEFHAYLEIKCQGSSSMDYPKKNFTIKMYSDKARETKLKKTFRNWGIASNKYVLKADYLDTSHLRNVIGARLWGEVVASRSDYDSLPVELKTSPNNGAIDGFPVKVYTNGTYYGVYMFNIGKDDWMCGMDKDNPNHVLLCAETNTGDVYGETPCNFRTLWNGVDGKDWSVEVGTNSDKVKNSLNALITCIKDTDDETFKATIGEYLDVQSAIDYYLHQYVICGNDNLGKNMLLATYDLKKWIMGAYDMDRAFGIKWEDGLGNADTRCPEDYREKYNLLFERLENVFTTEMISRYLELRKSVYTNSNMISKMENLYYTIGTELYSEEYEIWTEMYFKGQLTIQHIRQFISDRLVYVDGELPNIGYKIECEGISLDRNETTISEPTELLVTVTPSNTTDEITWESSNDSIATVNNGVVTPKGIGECVITVTCGNYSAECNVTVELISLASQITWENGRCLDTQTGNTYSDEPSSTTDFINLCGAKHLVYIDESSVNETFNTSICFYNSNKEKIGNKGSYSLTTVDSSVSEGAAYARIVSKTQNTDVFDILSDVDLNGYIKLDDGKFVNNKKPSGNGDVEADGMGYYDEFIPVSEGDVVTFANLTHFYGEEPEGVSYGVYYVFYNAQQLHMGEKNKENKTLTWCTIPSGVSYVKLVAHNATKEHRYYKILG